MTLPRQGLRAKRSLFVALHVLAQGVFFTDMLTTGEHITTVHHIIGETLASCRLAPFPDFQAALAATFDDRTPSAEKLPWLMLPIFVCEALEGDVALAHYPAAALEMGRIAAGCLDEWQDRDTHGALWRVIGAERTISLATGTIALSLLALSRLDNLGVEAEVILHLQREFHLVLLHMSAGQYADLDDDLSLDDYEAVAGAKSGTLSRLGCRAGAIITGAPAQVICLYGDFGYNLGILDQVWNDLRGAAGVQGKRDADHRRALPHLAAQALDPAAAVPQPAEEQAGQLYTLVQLQAYHQRAAEALAKCPAPGRLPLFLDRYSPHPLIERASQAVSPRGGNHVE